MAPTKTGIKAKNMMYTQQLRHMFTNIQDQQEKLDKLEEIVKKQLKPERYALTVHSQDIDKHGKPVEPHVHLMMSFKNARSLASVAKKLGDKPQYIEQWNGNANNGYAYLVHRTKSSRNRYQYDPADVVANFDYAGLVTEQIPQEIARARDKHINPIKEKLDLLYAGGITKKELENQLSGSELAYYNRQIDIVWGKRLQKQAADWRAEMKEKGGQVQTIWIYGPAGTGKTSLAKDYAERRGHPYYMAGSSRDIFQGYAGQHTLILDELRPHTIPYHDLLRIADPFGMVDEVMAPSRYVDKALACDLIIVTTPYSPYEFYKVLFPRASAQDNFDQLSRRIFLTLNVKSQNIDAMKYDTVKEKYHPIAGATKSNPYSQSSRPAAATNPLDLFNEMF